MKRLTLWIPVCIAATCAAGWYLFHASAPAPQAAAVDVSAAVSTVVAKQAVVSTTVAAYGDVAPGQLQSISFPRAGQLAELLVVAGQRIRKGQVVARLIGDPATEATYRQAEYALSLAEGEFKRVESLFTLQLATTSQVEIARKAVKDALANQYAQQKLGGGQPIADVLSPFDGVVIALNAAQGERLAAGAPVAQVGRIDRLKVNLGIEPAERYRVQVGNPVELTVMQMGSTAAGLTTTPTKQSGKINAIQDIVDPKTQLVSAAVDIAEGSSISLVPGMRMSALIKTGEQNGWVVPRQAVLKDDQGAYLFQVQAGIAHRVAVVQQAEQGQELSVSGPLNANLPVVSLGNYELSDGMKVREAKP